MHKKSKIFKPKAVRYVAFFYSGGFLLCKNQAFRGSGFRLHCSTAFRNCLRQPLQSLPLSSQIFNLLIGTKSKTVFQQKLLCVKNFIPARESKKFYGKTKNAVKFRIYIALIFYRLCLKFRQMSKNAAEIFTHFICKLSVCFLSVRIYSNDSQAVLPKIPVVINLQHDLGLLNYLER